MKLKRKKPKSVDFKPIAVLSTIALLLIGFIYWSEHAAVPAKRASVPVKHAAVPVRQAPALEKHEAVTAKQEAVPVKKAAVPAKHAETQAKVSSVVPIKLATIRESVSSFFVKPTINEKVVVHPPVVEKKKVVPISPVLTGPRRPRVAIVIDDFGYNMNNVEAFFDINMPITISVLPRQRYSREIAEMAHARGHEVILHLPMESWRPEVKEEVDTIRAGMSDAEIVARIKKGIADVPGLSGVNNHQGSKATEDKQVMTDVLQYLKKNNLYFLDSFTTAKSVGPEVASETGVKFVRRNKFLDNDNDAAAIEKQMEELKAMAIARGRAVAIGHDRKTTVAVLAKMMPEMAKEGIEFVYLSDMVK